MNMNLTGEDELLTKEYLILIMMQVLEFLSILHSNNYYYGDLKPSNILIGFNSYIKFTDFGGTIFLNQKKELFYMRGYTKGFC